LVLFTAEFLGFPLVPPFYGSQNANFEKGVNFAVGGATALERSFLEERGIHFPYTNVSLAVQLSSFKESLPNLCVSPSGLEDLLCLTYVFPVLHDKNIKSDFLGSHHIVLKVMKCSTSP